MSDPEDILVRSDSTLTGITAGAIVVDQSAHLVIAGTHAGPVELSDGAILSITGQLAGPVDVPAGSSVEITGSLAGPLTIEESGVVIVRARGSLAGPVNNEGTLRNFGKRAGPIEGDGLFEDEPGSTVITPEIGPDGSHTYRV